MEASPASARRRVLLLLAVFLALVDSVSAAAFLSRMQALGDRSVLGTLLAYPVAAASRAVCNLVFIFHGAGIGTAGNYGPEGRSGATAVVNDDSRVFVFGAAYA